MLRGSLRVQLLLAFVILLVIVGTGTMLVIERTLASDLLSQLRGRLTIQGQAVSVWLARADHPDQLVVRLSTMTSTRVTIVDADGLIQADSTEPETKGLPIGDAPEVKTARHGEVGSAIRAFRDGEARQYMVAVPSDHGRVVRLSVPVDDVVDTRARMRNRLLAGGLAGFLGCVLLSFIFIRALTRPLQSMTHAARRFAQGDYDVPTPTEAGGELGVLAEALTNMAGEVKARVGELTQQRDLLQSVLGELTQQRDLLKTVLGGLVEGVVVVDQAGAVAFVNEAAFSLVGDAAVHPALKPLVELALAGEPGDRELAIETRTVRASARPLSDHGAIVVLYDVTQIRALERVRAEFLSNAAHELRTPVTSISGYAETLLGGGVDAETSKEFLEVIHRNAGRITSLVADLLMLDKLGGRARSVVGDRTAVSLDRVCRDAARTAQGVVPDASIEIDVPGDLSVLGTREGLDHVVQNLVDNAIKYGGETCVTISASRHGKRVRLAIADTGPGVPAGHEERVFERFYRLDFGRSRDVGSNGLGLAIVKSQVEAIGGRVWVEHANPGARFVVELDSASDEMS